MRRTQRERPTSYCDFQSHALFNLCALRLDITTKLSVQVDFLLHLLDVRRTSLLTLLGRGRNWEIISVYTWIFGCALLALGSASCAGSGLRSLLTKTLEAIVLGELPLLDAKTAVTD